MVDLKAFEDELYQKFAPSTVHDTVRKMRYLGRRTDLTSRDSIMEFLREERRNGASTQRINGYVKVFNRWLEFNHEEKILYLKEQKRSFKVRYYDHEQIRALLERSQGQTVEDKRNHAMILLALNTGLRREEITNLRVIDVHQHHISVIKGKGDKDRDVYLDPETRSVLVEFARVRNQQGSPYLFTTRRGKITPNYMGKIALDIRQKTGIEFSWHKCRHTYAKMMLRNDVDLESLRQMLGHEDLGTTQIYSVIDSGEAIERIAKRKIKFYREGVRYKPLKSYTISNGPAGINTSSPHFGGIYTWNQFSGMEMPFSF